MDFAFDPNFTENRFFYVSYTINQGSGVSFFFFSSCGSTIVFETCLTLACLFFCPGASSTPQRKRLMVRSGFSGKPAACLWYQFYLRARARAIGLCTSRASMHVACQQLYRDDFHAVTSIFVLLHSSKAIFSDRRNKPYRYAIAVSLNYLRSWSLRPASNFNYTLCRDRFNF